MNPVRRQLVFLGSNRIECVIVGGIAGTLHGSAIPTSDLDVCYSRAVPDVERLAAALRTVNARLRNAPADLPFRFDAETLLKGLNFTFATDVGALDLLGEVRGVGYFEQVVDGASSFTLLGYDFKVIALDKLITAKRTAGSSKDMTAVSELEALLESRINEQRHKNSRQ